MPGLSRGDINGDGVINQDDVAPLRDLVMERNSDFRAYVQGDFSNDGVRDITDALAILNYNGIGTMTGSGHGRSRTRPNTGFRS